jgi:hypothetical protein
MLYTLLQSPCDKFKNAGHAIHSELVNQSSLASSSTLLRNYINENAKNLLFSPPTTVTYKFATTFDSFYKTINNNYLAYLVYLYSKTKWIKKVEADNPKNIFFSLVLAQEVLNQQTKFPRRAEIETLVKIQKIMIKTVEFAVVGRTKAGKSAILQSLCCVNCNADNLMSTKEIKRVQIKTFVNEDDLSDIMFVV